MSRTLETSPNACIDKKVLDRYLTLELPENKVQATYIWIDGTGQSVRCKDRTLDFIPKTVKGMYIYLFINKRERFHNAYPFPICTCTVFVFLYTNTYLNAN